MLFVLVILSQLFNNFRNIMEAFYDSNEDVSWGPITLREMRRDMRSVREKIERRHSDLGIAPRFSWYVELEDMVLSEPTKITTTDCDQIELNVLLRDSEEYKSLNFTTDTSYKSCLIERTENDLKFDENKQIETIESFSGENAENCIQISTDNETSLIKDTRLTLVNNTIYNTSVSSNKSGSSRSSENYIQTSSDNDTDLVKDTTTSSANNTTNNTSINSNKSDSNCFNDTIEEVEAMLKLNQLVIQSNIVTSNLTPLKSVENLKELLTKPQTPKPIEKQTVKITPTSNSKTIHKPIERNLFKLPKTVDFKTPNPKSPASIANSKKFKNIVSPVSLYIKNSPGFYLKTNAKSNIPIKRQVVHRTAPNSNEVIQEEQIVSFPEVVYKPSKKKVFLSQDKCTNLPSCVQKLGTEVVKHEKKIINRNTEKTANQKLLELDDLTFASDTSSFNDCTYNADISILTSKQKFIK